jgi:hypothetical protein
MTAHRGQSRVPWGPSFESLQGRNPREGRRAGAANAMVIWALPCERVIVLLTPNVARRVWRQYPAIGLGVHRSSCWALCKRQ